VVWIWQSECWQSSKRKRALVKNAKKILKQIEAIILLTNKSTFMNKAFEHTMESGDTQTSISSDETDTKDKVTLLSAKRQYWIEWECLLDKFPTQGQLKKLNKKLREYIANYLDELVSHKYEIICERDARDPKKVDRGSLGAGIFDQIEMDIREAFESDQENKLSIEFNKWEIDRWTTLDKSEYAKAAVENIGIDSPDKKHVLKYTVYTRKWMEIFEHDWQRVSDSHLVFSYRGWFVTKNNIRLTNENRGSMNPPPPPPPPR
jgi:hypothetical protein